MKPIGNYFKKIWTLKNINIINPDLPRNPKWDIKNILKTMNISKNIINNLSLILIAILLIIGSYYLGYRSANKTYQLKMERMELNYQKEISILKDKVKAKENEYRKKLGELETTINIQQNEYETALNNINEYYDYELRESKSRAEAFRNMSRSRTDISNSLADHAARLDESLVKGRQLVKELRETIKLRDRQIKYLGNELQLTHELME